MRPDETAAWRRDFIRATHDEYGRRLSRRASRGELIRLAPGIYLPSEHWRSLEPRRQHLAEMRAQVLLRERRLVFSHWSAATALGLPLLDTPDRVHVVAPRAGGGRSDNRVQRHCLDIGATVVVDGLEVTAPALTAAHLAASATWSEAVVVADAVAALHPDAFERERNALPDTGRGAVRSRRVMEFADARSGSAGESVSRASIATAGLSRPELQTVFDDDEGVIVTDFYWHRWRVAGEFDGAVKYLRPEFRNGRTPSEVVVAEKWREDRLRRQVDHVVRWDWRTAGDPARLGALLRAAGVR